MQTISQDKLKDVLTTRTAIKVLQPESVVDKVISFQFKDVRDMIRVHHQIEISGFGKLLISANKVRRRIERMDRALVNVKKCLEKEGLSETQVNNYRKKVRDTEAVIEYLKTRENGYEN